MGLFSSKKIITVSSTLYNMAGDEDDRPDFLKGTMFGAVMADAPSLADEITGAYFNGPGQKQLQFFRYCQQVDYSIMPTASIVNSASVDATVVAGEIPLTSVPPAPAGLEIAVFEAFVSDGDFEPWIEKYILANMPERMGEEYLGEYEPNTDEFSIEFPNNDFFSFANDGTYGPIFNSGNRYIIAKYIEFSESSEGDLVEGTPVTVNTLPDVTDFDLQSNTPGFAPATLQRTRTTTYSYNNGDPDEIIEDAVDADVAVELNRDVDVYQREVTVAQNGLSVEGERQTYTFTGADAVIGGYSDTVVTTTDMGGGVIRTETSVTTGEQVDVLWDSKYDTQALYIGEQYGPEQIFIYEVGTGNATLDDLVGEVDASGFQEFFPFVPVRINNVSIEEPQYSDLLAENEAIYRRAFPGKRFGELVETVEENPSIDDIDYAYLCWGASLNAKDNSAKIYAYDFFKKMIPFQNSGSGSAMSDHEARIAAYDQAVADLAAWEAQYGDNDGNGFNFNFGEIPPRPVVPSLAPPPTTTIKLKDSSIGIDYRLTWVHIEEEQFTGTFEVVTGIQSKIKDCKMEVGPDVNWETKQSFNDREDWDWNRVNQNSIPSMKIYRQIDENTYRVLTIWGLVSQNYIYGGKAVTITSKQALQDDEESGFLVPLHYPTMLEMNIIDYTQLCTSNSHILFNSYEVTKQKWWQRGIFKILLVIAIIIVAVVVFPGAFAAGGGILGGNLAIGTALGLTGTAAIVAGVVANYIASIIIAEVLKIVGTELFGEKWGALFAALATFAIGMAISGTSLFSAEGLLGLGNALANGYAGWVQGDIAEMQADLEDDRSEYEDRMEYIQNLIDDLDGESNLNFNPMSLTRAKERGNSRGYLPETAEQYIRRTTMTGTQIVELTHDMVYEYVTIARTLPRN
jgi:hypothetical protein